MVIRTRIVWSNAEQTDSPNLSTHQSKEVIGCSVNVQFCNKDSSPVTPYAIPSESFSALLVG